MRVYGRRAFINVTCSLGTHLNDDQFRQLCEGHRTVYLTFDVDQPTRAASKLQSNWPIVLSCTASPHVAFCCLRGMIPTPSSSKEETHTSSSLCWRLRSHEVPRHLSEDFFGRT